MLRFLGVTIIGLMLHRVFADADSSVVTKDGSMGYGDGTYSTPKEPADFRDVAYGSHSFKYYKVIRIIPRNAHQLSVLRRLEAPVVETDDQIQFWRAPSKINIPVDIMISPSGYNMLITILARNGMPHILLNDDLGKDIANENRYHPATAYSSTTGFDYGRYHQFQEIVNEMKSLISRHRSLAKLIHFGYSNKGYKMEGIKISSGYARGKKTFFLNCGIHAREWVSPATCIYLMSQMLTKYGKDQSITEMIDKMDWVILPVLNVEGYMFSWSSKRNRLWRKTRSQGTGSCIGVDPNRNFAYKWGGLGASTNPCKETYRGSRPFSEIEVRNLARYLYSIRHTLAGFADIHSFGQYWLIPWGYDKIVTKDNAEQMRVANAALRAIKNMPARTIYQAGSSAVLLNAAAGGSDDWAYGALNVKYSFTVELRDTGRYHFVLPANQIIPTASEALEGLKATAKAMIV